jgi:hypothetical protein
LGAKRGVDRGNRRVAQLAEHRRLALEQLEGLEVIGGLGMQYLEGDVAAEPDVARQQGAGEGARAQRPDDFIAVGDKKGGGHPSNMPPPSERREGRVARPHGDR